MPCPAKRGGKAGIVKKSSMADVARLAGVSTATVSHVINRSRFVSEEVTQQVEKAIRQLNYIPNQMARNLKTGRNHTVLFIVPDIANSFFATAIEAVESVLVAAGYRLVIANTKEDFAREAVHLQGAGNGTIDGLLLASTAGQWEQVAPLLPAGLPTVLVDRVFEHTGSSVSVDSAAALGQAVKSLAAQGHARIGFISGIARLSSTKERLAAYRQAMAACGLPVEDGFVQTGDSMRARGYGLKGRSSYSVFAWSARDSVVLAVILVFVAAVCFAMSCGYGEFSYYPAFSPLDLSPYAVALYAALTALAWLSTVIEIKENILWQSLRSKI